MAEAILPEVSKMIKMLGTTARVMNGGVSHVIADMVVAPPMRRDKTRKLRINGLFIFPTPFPPLANLAKQKRNNIIYDNSVFEKCKGK
jgi:hypothetical protein